MIPRVVHHSGQIIASQAAAALCLAAWDRGVFASAGAIVAAAGVLLAAWARRDRRWLYQWLGVAARYAVRRRTLPRGADPLPWVCPGAELVADECDGEPAGVIETARGRTALVELGEVDGLLAGPAVPLPPLSELAALAGPGVALRLVIGVVPAASGAGLADASYRQLDDGLPGRLPVARQRVVLGVQALRADGIADAELRQLLGSAVRRIRRRLAGVGARLLTERAAAAVLLDLAHLDGAGAARERWDGVQAGGYVQATFRVPDPDVARLLAVPAAVTIALGPAPTVRLAAPGPVRLAAAGQALCRIAPAVRLDGEHRPALAGTLPIHGEHGGQSDVVPIGGAGLMLGTDRHGQPVLVRLFRPEPTLVLLVGGPRMAQRLTLRALALGAGVTVHSARAEQWRAFLRAIAAPDRVTVATAGGHTPELTAAGTALRPRLAVVDTPADPVRTAVPADPMRTAVPADPVRTAVPAAPWRTVLVVRDELTAADVDLLAGADLAMLPPLTAAEAELAAPALGLGATGEWLSRIRGGMLALVQRRTVRWVLLSQTQVEEHLFGTACRG